METFSAAVPQMSKVQTMNDIAESGLSTKINNRIENALDPKAIARFSPWWQLSALYARGKAKTIVVETAITDMRI